MKYLICIGHPSQFHLFKNIISDLKSKEHDIRVLISPKDILEELFNQSSLSYDLKLPKRRSGSYFSLVVHLIKKIYIIGRVIIKYKPGLLLGSEVTFPFLGKIFSIPSIVFSEDDAKIIPQFAKLAYPFASTILSPKICNAGKWECKKIGYDGYQKLAYLHPNHFSPDAIIREEIANERFFLLRFAELTAYHDTNREGIDSVIAAKLIEILRPHGKILITSERQLEPEFEKYRLKINPLDIHSLLYYADLYIGDSQSMAMEAAILGTPSIRFNDFAGEIGVLEELEHKYQLTVGIKTTEPEELFRIVSEHVKSYKLKTQFGISQKKMLNDKIDVLSFMLWFIENYPKSLRIMFDNPNFQYKFK